jgi:hypothetical protein
MTMINSIILQAAEVCCRPMPVKLLHDVMVTQVVCGRFHTICVTAQSQVRGGRLDGMDSIP